MYEGKAEGGGGGGGRLLRSNPFSPKHDKYVLSNSPK